MRNQRERATALPYRERLRVHTHTHNIKTPHIMLGHTHRRKCTHKQSTAHHSIAPSYGSDYNRAAQKSKRVDANDSQFGHPLSAQPSTHIHSSTLSLLSSPACTALCAHTPTNTFVCVYVHTKMLANKRQVERRFVRAFATFFHICAMFVAFGFSELLTSSTTHRNIPIFSGTG